MSAIVPAAARVPARKSVAIAQKRGCNVKIAAVATLMKTRASVRSSPARRDRRDGNRADERAARGVPSALARAVGVTADQNHRKRRKAIRNRRQHADRIGIGHACRADQRRQPETDRVDAADECKPDEGERVDSALFNALPKLCWPKSEEASRSLSSWFATTAFSASLSQRACWGCRRGRRTRRSRAGKKEVPPRGTATASLAVRARHQGD